MKFLRWAYRLAKIGIFIWAFISWAETTSSTGTPRDAFLTLFVFALIDIAVFIYDAYCGDYDLPFMDLGAVAICKFIQIFMFVWVVKAGYDGEMRNFLFLFWSGALDIYAFVEKVRNKF